MLMKVLIVDDSELIHHMYRLVLHRYGCEFADAMNGREALEILEREEEIDLVLLDINMPVMNGVQFMESASARGITRRLPVIVISSEGNEVSAREALRLGAKGYLEKPFKAGELHALIDSLLPASGWRPAHPLRAAEPF